MTSLSDLLGLSRRELGHRLQQGHPVEVESLANREFHGVALGLPRFVERLTWKKFKKVFVTHETGLQGYNEAVTQNGLQAPWISRTRRGEPVRYGYFEVRPAERGLLIDYGPPAHRFNPMRFVQDPLVAVDEGSSELLLGVSILALGRFRVPTPTYFALLPGDPIPVGVSR